MASRSIVFVCLRLLKMKLSVACGRSQGLGRFLFVLILIFLIFLFRVADFDATLEDRAFFNADAVRDHVA